ncbi:MAG TPA: hypothetical protein VJP87_11830 [Candidatus Acidoferrales bacterium]|nr:hypothetical protein [Candidatus Acidoferrales bacterium]
MTLSSISQANGADLLSLYSQSTGQSNAPVAAAAAEKALKTALAEAQISASEILGASEGGNNSSGSQLNVYG